MTEINMDLKNKFNEVAKEYNASSSYAGIKLKLYFGEDKFKDTYVNYLTEIYDNLKRFINTGNVEEVVRMVVTDADEYENLTKYIERHNEDESRNKVNDHWKENQDSFIKLLNQYIGKSLANKEAGSRYINALITANATDSLHCFYELIQNADDCEYEKNGNFKIDFSKSKNEKIVTVEYNEKGMDYTNIIALTSFNESDKANDVEKIGEKGQGFKTVFSLCDKVEIGSGGFSFQYICTRTPEKAEIKIEKKENACDKGTKIVLHLTNDIPDDICKSLLEKYGINNEVGENATSTLLLQEAFSNCPLMFTKKLNSMKIKVSDTETYTISNKHSEKDDYYTITYEHNDNVNFSIDYIRYENSVSFSENEWESRYGKSLPYNKDNKYSIYIAAPINTQAIKQGKLYTYLPTEEVINSPMNIHFPAFLNNNRSTFGLSNGEHILWNERLVKDFFAEDGWYVGFFEQMKKHVKSAELINYLPQDGCFFIDSDLETLFNKYRNKQYKIGVEIDVVKELNDSDDIYKRLKIFKLNGTDEWKTGSEIWMPDKFAEGLPDSFFTKFKEEYSKKFPATDSSDYNITEKEQAEYCENFISNKDLHDLTGYQPPEENADVLTVVLNQIMNEPTIMDEKVTVRDKITDFIFNDKKSAYLPQNRKNRLMLEIFPYKIHNKKDLCYKAVEEEKEVWVCNDEETAAPEESFIRVCDVKKESIGDDNSNNIFKKLGVIDNYDSIFEYVIEKTSGLLEITFDHIKDILDFFAKCEKPELDWYEFGKDILKSAQKEIPLANLAELINEANPTIDNDLNNKIFTLMVLASGKIADYEVTIPKELPLRSWSDDLMDAVIKAGQDTNDNITITSCFDNTLDDTLDNTFDIFLKKKKYNVYESFQELTVYVCDTALPEGRNFFHYNKIVVLRNTKKDVLQECTNSIMQGIAALLKCKSDIDGILDDEDSEKPFKTPETAMKLGKLLEKNLAFEYHNTLIGKNSNESERKERFGDNIIAYELVQNADDCHKRGKLVDDTLEVTISSQEITLQYADAGFSPKDLFSICSRHNSANNSENSNTTGKKGTGFKSVFRCYDTVKIKSNYFELILSTKDHPKYKIKKNEIVVSETERIPYEEDSPVYQPIPSFTFNYKNELKTTLTLSGSKNTQNTAAYLSDFRTYLFTECINTITITDNINHKKVKIKKVKENTKVFVSVTESENNSEKTSKYEFYGYEGKWSQEPSDKPVTLLFPDENTMPPLAEKTNIPIYCSLPLIDTKIPAKSKLCFFVNSLSIECDDYRRSSKDGEIKNIENGIFYAFNAFAKKHQETAYKNYPVGEFYKRFRDYSCYFTECKFIPTKNDGLISMEEIQGYNGMLAYSKKENFVKLLKLCQDCGKLDESKEGKFLLKHYETYTGKTDVTPNTPIQTVIEGADEEIAGYLSIKILSEKLAEEFSISEDTFVIEPDFEIEANMFKNVRSTLFTDSDNPKMDKFAEEVIKQDVLDDLFKETCKLHWDDSYIEIFGASLLENLRDESVWEGANGEIEVYPFMYFDNGTELPDDLSKKFTVYIDCNLDIEEKDVILNKPGNSAVDIIGKAIYYNAPKNFTEPLYFWGTDIKAHEEKLIIFGEKAFSHILDKLFKLKSKKEKIELSVPIFSLPKIRGGGFSEELTDRERFIAVAEDFPYDYDLVPKDDRWKILLYRTDYRFTDKDGTTTCYHWKGYGAEAKDKDTVCPVCEAKLLSAVDSLGVYEFKVSDETELPLIMCKNCGENLSSKPIYFYKCDEPKRIENIYDYLAEHSEIQIELNLSYGDGIKSKTIYNKIFLTTPHRLLIYKIKLSNQEQDE